MIPRFPIIVLGTCGIVATGLLFGSCGRGSSSAITTTSPTIDREFLSPLPDLSTDSSEQAAIVKEAIMECERRFPVGYKLQLDFAKHGSMMDYYVLCDPNVLDGRRFVVEWNKKQKAVGDIVPMR